MTPQNADGTSPREKAIARRPVLRGLGAGALAAGGGGLLAACGTGLGGPRSPASGKDTITIGFITPLTGRLAHFAAGDSFVVRKIRATAPYSAGFRVGGKRYRVQILTVDSQSNPGRASQAARHLIVNHNVDMLVTTSTPDTANPVAVIGETEGVPCLSTVVPRESWYAGLGGNPDAPTQAFQFCTMYFFGMSQLRGCTCRCGTAPTPPAGTSPACTPTMRTATRSAGS
jgi:branched-chain amino acid transport system substrate-binding protein